MYIKYSFSVLISHLVIVFKAMLFIAIVMVIALALGIGLLLPAMRNVVGVVWDSEAMRIIREAFDTMMADGYIAAFIESITENIGPLWDVIVSNAGTLWLSYIILCLVALLGNFLLATLYLPLSDNMNKYISTRHYGYMWHSYFATLKKSLFFSLFYSLINTLTSIIIIWIGVAIAITARFNIFTLNFIAIVFIFLYSMRATLLCRWIPGILSGKKVLTALKDSIKWGGRPYVVRLCNYTFILSAIYIFAIVFMSSLGFALIIGIPFLICFFRTFELVGWKIDNKEKFYADDYVIISPN